MSFNSSIDLENEYFNKCNNPLKIEKSEKVDSPCIIKDQSSSESPRAKSQADDIPSNHLSETKFNKKRSVTVMF